MRTRSARLRRADSPAVLGPGVRCRTHFASFARYVQTVASESEHEARAGARATPGPALLGAPKIGPPGHRPPRQHQWWYANRNTERRGMPERLGKGAGG